MFYLYKFRYTVSINKNKYKETRRREKMYEEKSSFNCNGSSAGAVYYCVRRNI